MTVYGRTYSRRGPRADDGLTGLIRCDRCGHIKPGKFALGLCDHCAYEGHLATANDVVYGSRQCQKRVLATSLRR